MKYLLALLLCLFSVACQGEEAKKTTKAEKWELLEKAQLFRDQKSKEEIDKIESSLHWKAFLHNKAAKEEEEEWKSTRIDFFLDNANIIKAADSLKTYHVLETSKEDGVIEEKLSNDMRIHYAKGIFSLYFPEEEGEYQLRCRLEGQEFSGQGVGGYKDPLEAKIRFTKDAYSFQYYRSPLSEGAWEKLFFLTIAYYNEFLERQGLKKPKIQEYERINHVR